MVDEQLLNLRASVYGAAINFHRVTAEYFEALRTKQPIEEKDPIIVAVEESASIYRDALDDLLKHLHTLESKPNVEEEIERTIRVQELLKHELQLMQRSTS